MYYDKLFVTPEFEHYKKVRTKESCPIMIKMKTESKEWITERTIFTRLNSNLGSINLKNIPYDQELMIEILLKINRGLDLEIEANALIPLREFVCDYCKSKISINEQLTLVLSTKHDYDEQNEVFVEQIDTIQILHGNEQCVDHNIMFKKSDHTLIGLDTKNTYGDQLTILFALQDKYPTSQALRECIKRITIPYYEEYRLNKIPLPPQDWSFQKFERAVLRDAVLKSHSNL